MSEIDQRRFGGIARVYGSDALQRFAAAKVTVVGVGGVGSWAVEALARSGVEQLTLIDLDHVAESNINRQLQAIEPNLGKAKVRALMERVAQINSRCRVEAVEAFIEAGNIESLITADNAFVIDCIDNFRVKCELIAYCRRNKIPLIVSGGAGGMVDPTLIKIADLSRTEHDPLLARTRKLLRQDFNFPRNPKRRFNIPCVYSMEQQRSPVEEGAVCERPEQSSRRDSSLNCAGFGSVMTVTATFGLVAVSHVLKRLAEKTKDA